MSKTGSYPVDHAGCRYGRWTVLEKAPHIGVRTAWRCRCDCGTTRVVSTNHLVSGKSGSCGCLKAEKCSKAHRSHGSSETLEYGIWCRMKRRCDNPNDQDWSRYGGRGIRVCARWIASFVAFRDDMGPRPSPSHSVDRIDVNGNYEPGNCRWATSKEQGRNTRRNRIVSYRGRQMTLVEAVEISGLNYGTVKWRLQNGRTDEEAFR